MKKILRAVTGLTLAMLLIVSSVSVPVNAKTSYGDDYITHDFEEGDTFDDKTAGNSVEFGGNIGINHLNIVTAGSITDASDESLNVKDHTNDSEDGHVLALGARGNTKAGRIKFINILNENGLSVKDTGSTYEMSLWAYNPEEADITMLVSTYSNRTYDLNGKLNLVSGTGGINDTKNVITAVGSKSFTLKSREWTKITYTLTPQTTVLSSVGFERPKKASGAVVELVYFDDITVRMTKDNRVQNDDNDLMPFSEKDRFVIDANENTDVFENGTVYELSGGKSIKYAADKDYFNTRYIPDEDSFYKLNIYAASKSDNVKINATSINVDKTNARDESGNIIDEWNMDVREDYTLSSGMDDDTKASVISFAVSGNEIENGKTFEKTSDEDAVFKEYSIIFKDYGSFEQMKYGLTKPDVLRGFDIVSGDDTSYIYDLNLKKVNLSSPVFNGDFSDESLKDWGWICAGKKFKAENGRLAVTTSQDEESLMQKTAVLKDTDLKLSFKIDNSEGADVKILVNDLSGNTIVSEKIGKTNGEVTKEIPIKTNENAVGINIVSLKSGSEKTAYIDDIEISETDASEIMTDVSEENTLGVSGNISGYGVADNVNVYLVKGGFKPEDYTNSEAVFASENSKCVNGIYGVKFDMSSVESYYTDLHIVVTGMSGKDFVTLPVRYECAQMKEMLLKSISEAESGEQIKKILSSGSNPANKELLGLDKAEILNLSGIDMDFVCGYIYKNRNDIVSQTDKSDASNLIKYAVCAAFTDAVNNNLIDEAKMLEYLSTYEKEFAFEKDAYKNIFLKKSDDEKKEILKSVLEYSGKNKAEDISDIEGCITDNVVKSAIKNAASYTEVISVIEGNLDYLEISGNVWNIYKNADSAYKGSAAKKIAEFAKNTNDLSLIAKNIESLVNEAKSEYESENKKDNDK